jgi:acyl dehydratase
MKQGDTYSFPFSFTQDAVVQFASVTGDKNPIHIDPEYALGTTYKKPIMHGYLAGSIFSRVLGTMFPGEGTVYLKQTMEFLRPVYPGEQYEAIFTVKEVFPEKNKATIETIIRDSNKKLNIRGEASIMNKLKIVPESAQG